MNQIKIHKQILAIDPGQHYGWAYQDRFGVIESGHCKLKGKGILPDTIFELYNSLSELFIKYDFKKTLDLVVFEFSSFQRASGAARCHGMFVTCLVLLSGGRCKEIKSVTPSELKKFACGTGNAPKSEMVCEAEGIVNRTVEDNNEADAICLLEMFKNTIQEP